MKRGILGRPVSHFLLIAVLAILVYSNTFNVPFLFDDNPNIVENPIVMDLKYFTQPSEAEIFSGTFQYKEFMKRFIGYLSFALNYKAHGLDVRGYHITNLLIHIINGILLYSLVMLTFRTPWFSDSYLNDKSRVVALFSALLFVSHPVQTQAVTYIVQRFASLATMFYLMSLVFYVTWRLRTAVRSSESGAWKNHIIYIMSLVSAVLAMKTKETAFTLPLAIMLYEFLFFKGKVKMRLLRLMPLILTMLIIPLTYFGLYSDIDKPIGEMVTSATELSTNQSIRWIEYFFTEQPVLVTYLRLLVFPVGQSFDYKHTIYHSFFEHKVIFSFLFLFSIFLFGLYLLYQSRITKNGFDIEARSQKLYLSIIARRSSRLIAFGIFWFFLTLSVESSIIPLYNIIFEHRIYLPSVGVFIALSTALSIFSRRIKGEKVFIAVAMIIIIFSASTYARNGIWKSEISLWEDAMRKYPLNVRAYSNLSDAYHDKGMLDDAVRIYIKAIKLAPEAPQAHNNLALVYMEKGMLEKAVEHYNKALRIDPENPIRHLRIGNAYMKMGMIDPALEHFEIAVRLNPDDATAHSELGAAYESKGLFENAVEQYRIAAELEPRNPTSYYNLGIIYQSRGMMDNAIQLYQIALKADPDYVAAHGNLGVAYQSKSMIDKAIEHYRIALELDPADAQIHFNLGLVYFQKGSMEKAREEFNAAIEIDPDYKKARESLGRLDEKL